MQVVGNKPLSDRDAVNKLWLNMSGQHDINASELYINGELTITAFCQVLSAGGFYLVMKKGYGEDYHNTPCTLALSRRRIPL